MSRIVVMRAKPGEADGPSERLRSAWRDGWPGWVASYSDGVHAAVKHMRLLELTNQDGG